MLAWAFGNPPGAGYDEVAHYVKALGVGGGDLAGSPLRVHPEDLVVQKLQRAFGTKSHAPPDPRFNWLRRTSREFEPPANLTVKGQCPFQQALVGCLRKLRPSGLSYARSYVGTYQPFAYWIPGLAARAASSPSAAVRLGRLAGAGVCLVLLLMAATLLWGRGEGTFALVGLVVGVSPAILYTTTTINPSGPEIASSACFGGALLAVTRRERSHPSHAWAVAAIAGLVLASCRTLGPLFVVLALLVVASLRGRARIRAAVSSSRWPVVGAGTLIGLACVANWLWEFTRQPHAALSLSDIGAGITDVFGLLPSLGRQLVGLFGAFDIRLPLLAYVTWGLLVAAVVGFGLRLGTRRERLALTGLMAVALALVFALNIILHPTGFAVQGRYVLPALVLLPIASGEVARRHRRLISRRSARIYVICTFGLAAAVHLDAWYVNAHLWAKIGDGVSPPGGLEPWAIVLAMGLLALVAAGFAGGRVAAVDPDMPPV